MLHIWIFILQRAPRYGSPFGAHLDQIFDRARAIKGIFAVETLGNIRHSPVAYLNERLRC